MKPGSAWTRLGPDTTEGGGGGEGGKKTPFPVRLANASRAALASHAKRVRNTLALALAKTELGRENGSESPR